MLAGREKNADPHVTSAPWAHSSRGNTMPIPRDAMPLPQPTVERSEWTSLSDDDVVRRVLAGDTAKLMDALDGKILVNRTARTCSAELSPGEAISAFGQLSRERDPEAAPEAGYRSAAIGWRSCRIK